MIFSGGLEAFGWMSANCHNCKRYGETWDECTCPLAEGIGLASIGNPEPSAELFEEYGFKDGEIPAVCSQIEPINDDRTA